MWFGSCTFQRLENTGLGHFSGKHLPRRPSKTRAGGESQNLFVEKFAAAFKFAKATKRNQEIFEGYARGARL